MEGGDEVAALLDQDGVAAVAGQDAGGGAGTPNDGSADEHCFHLTGGGAREELGFGFDLGDAAIDLAAVGVAFDGDVHEAQAFLGGAGNLIGDEDGAGAGAEDGFAAAELGHGVEQAVEAHELEHGGAFAAGDDEGIERAEIGGLADVDGLGAGALDGCAVRRKVPLHRKHSHLLHGRVTSRGFAAARLRESWRCRGRAWLRRANGWLRAACRDYRNSWRPARWLWRARRGRKI